MELKFIRQVEIKRVQILKTSFDVHYKICNIKKNTDLILNEMRNQILLNGKEFSIENISKFLGSEKYQIRDSDSKLIVGDIIINGWGTNPYWQDSPSTPNAQIVIDKVIYNFRNITSWQSFNLFSRDRFKNYEFKLYSVYGNEYSDYHIKLEIPIFRSVNYFTSISFTGNLENNMSSDLLPLIGLFLVQKSFESEGKNYSG